MANFYGDENGFVYAKMNGEWVQIGECAMTQIEIEEDETEQDVLDKINEEKRELGEFSFCAELDIVPGDTEAMFEFVYMTWLGHKFPHLYWN